MKIKLTYFDFPFWRAEIARLSLFLGDIEFEDYRIPREVFKKNKEAGLYPFAQLPILEVDGIMIAQSLGIGRFCGKMSGLYPEKDHIKAALIDQILESVNEITVKILVSIREKDPMKRTQMRQDLALNSIPIWLGQIESLLKEHGEDGFLVGDKLSIADLAIWRSYGWICSGKIDDIPSTISDFYTGLQDHYKKISSIEKISKWTKKYYK